MTIKRIVFWAHLGTGVAAGLFILLMSVTGVLLTYERQMVAAAERGNRLATVPATPPLGAGELAAIAWRGTPQAARASLVFSADPAAPVAVTAGRGSALLLDPYSGAVIESAAAPYERFFHLMESWHRWFGSTPGGAGAALLRAANLLFLFLIVSGIYLWLPNAWRWPAVRFRMLFARHPINGKMRDFNWHHVLSFWSLIPLLLIVLSGVVISYGWANNLVYAAFGEEAPQRGGPRGGQGGAPGGAPGAGPGREPGGGQGLAGDADAAPRGNLDVLLATARSTVPDWQRITVPLADGGAQVAVTIERPDASRELLTLDARDARVVSRSGIPLSRGTESAGQRARRWFRFVHTGEEYGIVGQSIAGLATLAACLLVYTGLALAYRRLIRPLFRRSGAG